MDDFEQFAAQNREDIEAMGKDADLIRPHNRAAIEAHSMAARIDLIQGSSIDPAVAEVRAQAHGCRAMARGARLQ
jgi:cephalosporin hydroxylase